MTNSNSADGSTAIVRDMYFFVFRVLVSESGSIAQKEAYASCWIYDISHELAKTKAEQLLLSSAALPVEMLEDHLVTRESYEGLHDGLRYYEQALLDKEVAVIFTFNDEA